MAKPKIDTREINLPMQTREATVVPATIDSEKRTVDVVWSTGARVRRYDWWNDRYYDEELSLDPSHVDLSRLNNGAPFLNSHNAYELDAVIGVVVPGSARLEKGQALATIQFSARDDVAPIWTDVRAGIIRNISCGYNTRKYVIEDEQGEIPIYRAVDWTPMELSAVAIPADDGAKFRAKPTGATHPCIIENRAEAARNLDRKEPPMSDKSKTAADQDPAENNVEKRHDNPAPANPPVPANDSAAPDAARAAAITEERNRGIDIRAAVRTAKLPESLGDDLVTKGVTIDQARKAILDEMAKKSDQVETRGAHIQVGADPTLQHRAAAENALLHRFNPQVYQLSDHGREYRGMSLLEMGKELLSLRGINVRGMSKHQMSGVILGLDTRDGALHSISDFPILLSNVANKTLRAAYESSPQTFKPFCRQGSATDFKTITRAQMGGAPSLLPLNEQGGYERGTIAESKETYALATFGRVLGVTRQVLINDDLGAFTKIPEMFGRAGADLVSDTVWGIINANAAMNDAAALFHATHGNLAGAGTAITVPALGAARAAMRQQKGLEGRFINVQPKFLLVPSGKETEGQQITTATSVVYTKATDTNPFAATLQVIAEPRLDAGSAVSWYLAGEPSQCDTIEYSFLEGNEGVNLSSRIGFDIDGVELKVSMDMAAKALDWRGLYKNPGA